jgi:phage-related protein
VEIRIGLGESMREIEVEMDEGTDQAKVIDEFTKAQANSESCLWVTGRQGKRICVGLA